MDESVIQIYINWMSPLFRSCPYLEIFQLFEKFLREMISRQMQKMLVKGHHDLAVFRVGRRTHEHLFVDTAERSNRVDNFVVEFLDPRVIDGQVLGQ